MGTYSPWPPEIVLDPGLFRSTDHGATWQRVATGSFATLATAAHSGGTLWATDEAGRVVRSTDAGVTWVVLANPGVSFATALAVDPHDAATLYLGHLGGVLRSTDGGATWAPWNDGLLHLGVRALAFEPRRHRVWAATLGGGVEWRGSAAAQ